MRVFPLVLICIPILLTTACAKAPNQLTDFDSGPRISHGQSVEPSDPIFHSTVVFYINVPTGEKLACACSASLIAPDLAVTAAHCVVETNAAPDLKTFFLYFGNRGRNEGYDQAKYRRVADVRVHPKYRPSGKENDTKYDLALVHFVEPIPEGFAPARLLPSRRSLKASERILVAGYGLQSESGEDPGEILNQYKLYRIHVLKEWSTRMVEIKGRRLKGLLPGDSGGPAFLVEGEGPALWGVYSSGDFKGGYAYYEDLRTYTRWLEASAREMGANFTWPR